MGPQKWWILLEVRQGIDYTVIYCVVVPCGGARPGCKQSS